MRVIYENGWPVTGHLLKSPVLLHLDDCKHACFMLTVGNDSDMRSTTC